MPCRRSFDALVLKLAELAEGFGDGVERRHHAFFELGFHRRHRDGLFVVELAVAVGFSGGFAGIFFASAASASSASALGELGDFRGFGSTRPSAFTPGADWGTMPISAGVGAFKIDDVAQQDLLLTQFVAPHHDGFERQRAFAETRGSSRRGRLRCAWRWRFRLRALSSSTEPISRRYMRTGSSVRSASSRVLVTATLVVVSSRVATTGLCPALLPRRLRLLLRCRRR